jgi:hypothetical protein
MVRTVHRQASGDLGVGALMTDDVSDVADVRGLRHGVDGVKDIAIPLLFDPFVPEVVRVCGAEGPALETVARGLGASVDDLALGVDQECDIEVPLREVIIGNEVELACDVGIQLPRGFAEFISFRTGDRACKFLLGLTVASLEPHVHALDRHFRDNHQFHRITLSAGDAHCSLHEPDDALRVPERVLRFDNWDLQRRQCYDDVRFGHVNSFVVGVFG